MGLFDWLFKKSATATAGAMKVGDRVLAKWQDPYFYPGWIRNISAQGYMIAFDDGDQGWVHPAHVLVPDIHVGSKVFCRPQGGPQYFPATVSQQKGESILVRYDDGGGEEWTSIAMVRVQRPIANVGGPEMMPGFVPQGGFQPGMQPGFQPGMPMGMPPGFPGGMPAEALDLGAPLKDTDWAVGDRVLARWLDFFWYPGSILAMGEKGFHVLFDDGDQRLVQNVHFMPLLVEEGESIFIRPKNEPMRVYHPAQVTRVQGETLDVEFEDGRVENNTRVSRARFWRCPVRITSFPFEEGDRVLAHDMDECTYPAEIVTIQDDRVMVHFLDGPERMLTPERIQKFDLRPGMHIECRWRGGPNYFPGSLSKLEGERLYVNYDDGDQEWTSVRLVRLPTNGG